MASIKTTIGDILKADVEALVNTVNCVGVMGRGIALQFRKVIRLIDGFETAFGMELLATVHWVVQREGAKDFGSALQRIHAWNERKKQFEERQIRAAWDALESQGWLKN